MIGCSKRGALANGRDGRPAALKTTSGSSSALAWLAVSSTGPSGSGGPVRSISWKRPPAEPTSRVTRREIVREITESLRAPRHAVDLDPHRAREPRRGHGRAGGPVRPEVSPVHLVH